MSYFTLDDVKQLAHADGWNVDDKPYAYADDTVLKAYLLFNYQISEDFERIKMACLIGSKSALDPDISFEIPQAPRVGSYLQVNCKVKPGLMLGKAETCKISSSIPLYTYVDGTYTELPSEYEFTYGFGQGFSFSCMIEDENAVELSIKSEHLNEVLNITKFLPLRPNKPAKPNIPSVDDNSVIGICKIGSAVML